jgi:hypothetical protein
VDGSRSACAEQHTDRNNESDSNRASAKYANQHGNIRVDHRGNSKQHRDRQYGDAYHHAHQYCGAYRTSSGDSHTNEYSKYYANPNCSAITSNLSPKCVWPVKSSKSCSSTWHSSTTRAPQGYRRELARSGPTRCACSRPPRIIDVFHAGGEADDRLAASTACRRVAPTSAGSSSQHRIVWHRPRITRNDGCCPGTPRIRL